MEKCRVSDEVAEIIVSHLKILIEDFNARFYDLKMMVFPPWLLQPFLIDISVVELSLRSEFCELQCDDSMKCMFQIKGNMMCVGYTVSLGQALSLWLYETSLKRVWDCFIEGFVFVSPTNI